MRYFLTVFLMILLPAFATECSKFAAENYSHINHFDKAHITVKKEYTESFSHELDKKVFPYFTYGYGDLKVKGKGKKRITYNCLFDENKIPIWSSIYESK